MDFEQQFSHLKAERDVARHDLAVARRLVEEMRATIQGPDDAEQKVKRLIDILESASAHA
jgi:hypothetical protein